MTAGRMKIMVDPLPEPPGTDWATVDLRWISLATVRTDGGLVFTKAFVAVEPLFAETVSEGPPRLVTYRGRLYVLSGEITILRAILDGRTGFDAKVVTA